jgi:2,4-dienoyl-CoA reductase-like NADH-dependent reductase (Old Yellow Enzyme family)
MLVGGLRSREVMERVLSEGGMEFVSLCRPLVQQPDLTKKFESGEAGKAD